MELVSLVPMDSPSKTDNVSKRSPATHHVYHVPEHNTINVSPATSTEPSTKESAHVTPDSNKTSITLSVSNKKPQLPSKPLKPSEDLLPSVHSPECQHQFLSPQQCRVSRQDNKSHSLLTLTPIPDRTTTKCFRHSREITHPSPTGLVTHSLKLLLRT